MSREDTRGRSRFDRFLRVFITGYEPLPCDTVQRSISKAKEKIDNMEAANKAEVIVVHDKQKPAEKRLGLNLMINVLSLWTNSN